MITNENSSRQRYTKKINLMLFFMLFYTYYTHYEWKISYFREKRFLEWRLSLLFLN